MSSQYLQLIWVSLNLSLKSSLVKVGGEICEADSNQQQPLQCIVVNGIILGGCLGPGPGRNPQEAGRQDHPFWNKVPKTVCCVVSLNCYNIINQTQCPPYSPDTGAWRLPFGIRGSARRCFALTTRCCILSNNDPICFVGHLFADLIGRPGGVLDVLHQLICKNFQRY